MAEIPQDRYTDSTLALMNEGYEFISNRCRQYQSNVFQTRFLLFKKVICMRGEEAAKTFYDTGRFKREGVLPSPVKATLFGKGGVQGVDGEVHHRRKMMFMSLMSKESVADLCLLTNKQWRIYARKWVEMDKVVLFDEAQKLTFRAVCEWAGVPFTEDEVAQRAGDMIAMIDAFGALGKRNWRGRLARKRTEKWMKEIIRKVRMHEMQTVEGSVLDTVATHRDLQNNLLDEQIAAVELINVLRPTVATSWFVVFIALALHKHPHYRQLIQEDEEYLSHFVHEVRRFYPFAPFIGAEVIKDFNWNGYQFPRGRLVLLDLYGTNHDPNLWENPENFRAERFKTWEEGAYNLIPQGGGSYENNHRCAGEAITIGLMKVATDFLVTSMEYDVPEQDLQISLTRIPAIPESRFIITNCSLKKHGSSD